MTTEDKEELKSKIIAVLGNIYDPEIPVDIYKLGLIYGIDIDDEGNVTITMTTTTPNCPIVDYLPVFVKEKISAIMGVKNCDVELTFEPAWNPANLPEDVKAELGLDEGFEFNDLMY